MTGINKVILLGNLGQDPKVIIFESGGKKASFSLATTENYKDKEGKWVPQTEWHDIVLWGYLAERTEKYLKKGSKIYLEGKIKKSTWEDKEEKGKKKSKTEIIAEKLIMLDSKKDDVILDTADSDIPASYGNVQDTPTDDLPF